MNINDFKPKSRFSSRADVYDKYRPTYPQKIIDIFADEYGIKVGDVAADIGSGTGKFTDLLIKNDMKVFAVEPNAEMRAYAEKAFGGNPNFTSVDGSAEETTLDDASATLITVAQAFHWFDKESTAKEFGRILKPDGLIALVWNGRKTELTEFQKSYDELLVKYCPDYKQVDRKETTLESLHDVFRGKKVIKYSFENFQSVDLGLLIGRMKSSSYSPLEGDEGYEPLVSSLKEIFKKYEVDGYIEFEYLTNLFCIM